MEKSKNDIGKAILMRVTSLNKPSEVKWENHGFKLRGWQRKNGRWIAICAGKTGVILELDEDDVRVIGG